MSASALQGQLQRALSETTLNISESQQQQLIALTELIHKWNKAYNLTSVRDPRDMLIRHILDSVVVAPHIQGQHFIDVGTGPGLPGLPLAIVMPQQQFVLLDSLGKRIRFIKQAVFELGLENVTAVQARVEDYQPETAFDGVLSRAFASIKDMLHWCQHLVDSQGTFLALKGQVPAQELDSLPQGFTVRDIIRLEVPGLQAERHLIKMIKN
ncbi:16S rRNA (guanine(527)-N(7))-methyltransferase RsmG [Lacimicrobium alkaliphilum]|uniref:Ribosomal RNA small subunit methyltransferase G n=1 Tax=Lacimicrobium alkaliphilum TaxID=1526571 RepID=A0A0U2ZPD9_9ALTE|nr:16S rRNA (guanine(527)-N(7))-methyltransferase RsmG [Lacimicrobium alkaliphilum]ALT00157.1 16S rRNA (guanine(527)-N(7))-methyltransferase RsmG [Lacimicrobium alkaliphilum]